MLGNEEIGYGPDTWVTENSRYMGDSGADQPFTNSPDIGDSALDTSGTGSPQTGDWRPALETVDVRDMGDARASWLADALENDVSHG